MKIIVGGANSISRSIVGYLSRGNNDIAVIDNDENALNSLAQEWDILPILGLVSHPDILKRAEADKADLLIAATDSDEVNMIACQAAYTLFDIPRRVARINSKVYFKAAWGGLFNEKSLPIDLAISPEYEIAKAIMNVIKVPGTSAVYPLLNKKVQLLSFRITRKCPLVQIPLECVEKETNVVIASINRGGKVILPDKTDMLHGGDEISILTLTDKLDETLTSFGLEHKANERVVIVGGNLIARYLAERLESDDNIISCKIIDEDAKTASELARTLNQTAVFNGSIMSEAILEEAGIEACDAAVAVGFEDKDNLVAAMVAKKNGVENTIALVSGRSANTQIVNIGENILMDRGLITMSSLLKELRKVNMSAAYSLGAAVGEIWEIVIDNNSELAGQVINDIKLPDESRICGLGRGGEVWFNPQDKKIEVGDKVIFLTMASAIRKAEKFFSGM
ncbi:MAG: Trk system potassium transporter TrkA [Alphaproteobacteria bacterium]|nr:Trk system potassium transporter TrkA [Alphaproteobacteria bacterium]